MADKKRKVEEMIVVKWDGGSRLKAMQMAKDATEKQREAAIAERPELGRYLKGHR